MLPSLGNLSGNGMLEQRPTGIWKMLIVSFFVLAVTRFKRCDRSADIQVHGQSRPSPSPQTPGCCGARPAGLKS